MQIDLAKFGQQAIDVLKNGELFDPESLKFLNENMKISADVWKRVQRGRTETELRYSVLNDLHHPTPDSKYWQVYREANVQFESLVFASYEWRDNQADLEIIEAEIDDLRWEQKHLGKQERDEIKKRIIEGKIKKKKIERERKSMQMMSAKASAEDRVRELRSLYKIRDELIPNLQYPPESPNDHQLISYAQSLTMRVHNAEEAGTASASEINNLRGVRNSCLNEILKDGHKLNAYMHGLPKANADKIAAEFGLQLLPNPNENSDH